MQRINQLPAVPVRPDDSHKGTFGLVLIVGGSRGMSGAVALAGLGALRGGAGLVTLAIPDGILESVAAIEPSYLTLPLPETAAGTLDGSAQPILKTAVTNCSAFAVGPGWGTACELQSILTMFISDISQPMVIDADALNIFAMLKDDLSSESISALKARDCILTPHPGEFARLTGLSIPEIQANREEVAYQFAQQWNIVLVLKGQGTVITDGARIAINQTGNNGMATGGTGDVLTGLMTALLAQGMTGFEAAQLATHLHGLAGDFAAKELTQPAMYASDLPRYLPQAWATSLQKNTPAS